MWVFFVNETIVFFSVCCFVFYVEGASARVVERISCPVVPRYFGFCALVLHFPFVRVVGIDPWWYQSVIVELCVGIVSFFRGVFDERAWAVGWYRFYAGVVF